MNTRILLGVALVAVALAGCTGNFNVKQTEPLRVQLEGAPVSTGELGTSTTSTGTTTVTQREMVVEKAPTVQVLRVEVTARQVSAQPAKVLVLVKDQDTGQTLGQQNVPAQNGTGSPTALTVNVAGKNNVVIVTQVTEGVANVNVAAKDASATQTNTGTTSNAGTSNATTSTNTSSDTTTTTNTTSTNTTTTADNATVTYP